MSWSYKISKPFKWEESLKNGNISTHLKKIERSYRDKVRFYSIWFQIERIKSTHIQGAFAELGVYKGETANFIHEMDNSRELHLFDTFEGFDEQDLAEETSNDSKYNTSNFSDTSVDTVKELINGNENVYFHKGLFPQTTLSLQDKKYAFVSLDADLYAPTKAGLEYFYPKLSPGGVIVIHDYNHSWDGCRKAIDEFSKTIPETIVEIADWQGSAMIIKNSK